MVGGIDAFYNNWQPKPPPRRSTASPWPDASVFSHTTPNTLGDLRRRIDAYDKAANTDTFTDTYVERTGIWGARIAAGEASEHFYPQAKPELNKALHEKLNPFATGAVSYERILGLGETVLEIGPDEYFKTYRQFFTKEGMELYKEAVTDNFKGFLRPQAMEPIAPGEFLRNTLLGRNVEKITDHLKEGRFMAALSRLAGPLLVGWTVVTKTKEAYSSGKAQGMGKVELGKQTLKAFLSESVKSILCWEAGSIGFAIGAAAVCVGTFPALAAGILTGGVFSAACYRLLSKPTPPPKQHLSSREGLSSFQRRV